MFEYKVATATGELKRGTLSVETEKQALAMLTAKGFIVVELRDVSKSNNVLFSGPLTKGYIAVLMRQFAVMLESQIPIVTAIKVIQEEEKNPKAVEMLGKMYSDVQSGKTLYDSMSEYPKYFSPFVLSLIKTGETNGQLDKAFDRIATKLEKDRELTGKVKSAMIYPCILAVVAIGVIILLNTMVIPSFAEMFDSMGATLPDITQALLNMSDFFINYWWLVVSVLVLLVVFVVSIQRTAWGKKGTQALLYRIPIVKGIKRATDMANICRSLNALLSGGVPIIQTLEITKTAVSSLKLQESLDEVIIKIKQGISLHVALSEVGSAFTPLVLEMVKIGEESGTIDAIMGNTAKIYEQEVERRLKNAMSLMEPAITLVLGGIVAFIMISVVVPMFEMYSMIDAG